MQGAAESPSNLAFPHHALMTLHDTETKGRALVARVSAWAAIVLALSGSTGLGCTVVSGWSDLQNGGHTDAAAPLDGSAPAPAPDAGTDATGVVPGADSSTPDSAASGADAASNGDSSSSVVLTVACGSTRCAIGEGCCTPIVVGGGTPTCQAGSQSCSPPKTFASCSDSAQCTVTLGHAAQCCEEFSNSIPSVSCRGSCTSSGSVVCDPSFAMPGCDAGQTCKLSTDGFGYNICQ
jgi:hypothetical protein